MSLDALPAIAAREAPVATAAQMAEADRVAVTDLGVPLEALMENAGHQIAVAVRLLLGRVAGTHVVAVCGTGHNGGDALAAVRHLHGWGARVEAFVAGSPDALRPLARTQYEVLDRMGVRPRATTDLSDRELVEGIKRVDLVIDGLLGYSARGAPRGEIARLILATHAAHGGGPRPIVAVDLPSGIDPDTGEKASAVPGGAIAATATVALALPKAGLLREPARRWVGELVLVDIGIPAAAYERMGIDAHGLFAANDLLRIIH